MFESGKLTALLLEDRRMHDGVQTRETLRVGKHDGAKLLPIHKTVRSEDVAAKFAHHFVVSSTAGFDHLMRNLVGFKHAAAEFAKHRDHRGFPGGDSSGQADAQHPG